MEQIIGATIQAGRGDDFVTSPGEIENCQRFRCLSGCSCQRANASFECGNTTLEGVLRGVHDARIDISELSKSEEIRGVLRAIENK